MSAGEDPRVDYSDAPRPAVTGGECSDCLHRPPLHEAWCKTLQTDQPRPWTDAHRREAFVRLCELAIEDARGDRGARAGTLSSRAEEALRADASEPGMRRAMGVGGGGLDPARIDREVAIVRERVERLDDLGPGWCCTCSKDRDRASVVPGDADLVRDLRDIATGKIEHVFVGACPDVSIDTDPLSIGSETVRSEPGTCPACDVLRRADAVLGGAPASDIGRAPARDGAKE